jgi:pimeloyl-ACP methyl ester carboxylesterase
MPFAKVNDTELYYEINGQGEPLLLIPGLGLRSSLLPSG